VHDYFIKRKATFSIIFDKFIIKKYFTKAQRPRFLEAFLIFNFFDGLNWQFDHNFYLELKKMRLPQVF
jgi:hypothetical protein